MEAPQVSPRHNASTSRHTLLNTRNVLTLSILETKEIFIWSGPSTSTSTKFNKEFKTRRNQSANTFSFSHCSIITKAKEEKMCAQVIFSNLTLFRNLKSTPTEGNILEKDNYPVEHLVQKALQKVLIPTNFVQLKARRAQCFGREQTFLPINKIK